MRSVTGVCSVLVLMLPVVLCGCDGELVGNPRYETIQREVNIDGKQVVVIPFKDAQDTYFESSDGNELTEKVAYQMRVHMPKTRFVSSLPIRQKFDPTEMEALPTEELGEAVRADVVLLGRLEEFSTQEPKTTGILRGTCRVELELFDVRGKQSTWRKSLTIQYPERGVGIPAGDTTPEAIRDGLMKLAADTIAKKFYTHTRRSGPTPMAW